jgi:TatD DNase family protein
MKLFDSHAHLDTEQYDRRDFDAMLDRAWETGLVGIVAIAGSFKVNDFDDTIEIADKERRIWVSAGIHPHTASFATLDALDKLRFALDREKIVALGEIGLDYHYNHSTPHEQRKAFVDQIRMAHNARKPIIVHTRKADKDTVAILRDEGADKLGGVIHCFSSTRDLAMSALDLGFYISFSGIVTFASSKEIQEVAAEIPEERILAETDTPYLSPVPHRGKWPNEPARVLHVVEKLAEIRKADPRDMARLTVQNARRCFGLPEQEEMR